MKKKQYKNSKEKTIQEVAKEIKDGFQNLVKEFNAENKIVN